MLTNALVAKQIPALPEGKHVDGMGLRLLVKGKARRWVFRYRWGGRDEEISIGRFPTMSLAAARSKRAELADARDRGIDPRIAVKGIVAEPEEAPITFRTSMENYREHMRRTWTPAHEKEWSQSLDRIATPLMDILTANITEADVLAAILPHWATINETCRRVIGRIERIIEHADTGTEPCRRIFKRLPRGVAPPVKPREAMPWQALPDFVNRLRERPETAARALEFLLLTCTPRTGEVIEAKWGEIDGNLWHVPAARMKSREARSIPLTAEAMALLDRIRPADASPDGLIFPSARKQGVSANSGQAFTGKLGDNAMQTVLREMRETVTVHGFRSSFTDFVAVNFPSRMMEAERALDHRIGNAVQRAYLRTDFIDQRRQLAEFFTLYLTTGQVSQDKIAA